MRRLKNTKILAAILSMALIFANTGVCTFADGDAEDTQSVQDSTDSGSEGGENRESSSVESNEGQNDEPDSNHGENIESGDSGSDNGSYSSGNSEGGNEDSSNNSSGEYVSPAAEGVEEITENTGSNTGNDSGGSQEDYSFGEITPGQEVSVDEEISTDLLTTQKYKNESHDSSEEIPESLEVVSYSVSVSDSVTFDKDGNASFSFTFKNGSNPVRIDTVDLFVYPSDSVISYDRDSRVVHEAGTEEYSFRSSSGYDINAGEERSYVVTVPADTVDQKGSGKTLSGVYSSEDIQLTANMSAITYDPSDYHELSKESGAFYLGSVQKTETVEAEDESEEEGETIFEELHADYRIRTVKYDGETHEMAFPRTIAEGRKVLYSTDSLEWSAIPPAYSDEGDYICYYRLVDEETSETYRSGCLRMKIRRKSEKSTDTEKTEENRVSVQNRSDERAELDEMLEKIGETETAGQNSKLEIFLESEGINNFVGASSEIHTSEIKREHTEQTFPAVWVWMMAIFFGISFVLYSVTNNIWTGLYKAFVLACAHVVIFFRHFRGTMISA